jgi:23S rRNA (guanosine2251-2'-O)-methyltransferase
VVFGIHPVAEYLERAPEAFLELWLAAGPSRPREDLARRAAARRLAVRHAPPAELDALAGSTHHQGAVAVLREFAYADFEDVAADGVEDPRNLGALLRSIAAAGAGGLLVPRDRAAEITPAAEKAAAGATAFLPVSRVVNLARAIDELHRRHGYWAVALAVDAERSLYERDVPRPALLVVGGEAGLRPLVGEKCQLRVRIPMAPAVDSLNVAVAAAVACFEIRRGWAASS